MSAPFPPPFSGILNVRTSADDQTLSRFDEVNQSFTLEIPITRVMIPNATITVILLSTNGNKGSRQPIYSQGTVPLSVPPDTILEVQILPEDTTVKPGDRTSIYACVTLNGAIVQNASVTFVVVCLSYVQAHYRLTKETCHTLKLRIPCNT